MKRLLGLPFAALVTCQCAALAAVVYDNNVPLNTITDGRTNDPDYSIYIEHADNFTLSSASVINGLTWHGIYEGNAAGADSFSLKLYTLVGGLPTLTPMTTLPLAGVVRQHTGSTIPGGLAIYSYEASYPDQSLPSGTYALSIYNNVVDGVEWFWATKNTVGNGSYLILQGNTSWSYYSSGPEFSFKLTQVPEPGAAMSLTAGLTALIALRRRSRG